MRRNLGLISPCRVPLEVVRNPKHWLGPLGNEAYSLGIATHEGTWLRRLFLASAARQGRFEKQRRTAVKTIIVFECAKPVCTLLVEKEHRPMSRKENGLDDRNELYLFHLIRRTVQRCTSYSFDAILASAGDAGEEGLETRVKKMTQGTIEGNKACGCAAIIV